LMSAPAKKQNTAAEVSTTVHHYIQPNPTVTNMVSC